MHVNFPESSAKILQNIPINSEEPGNSFWVPSESLPEHLALAEELTTPDYLDEYGSPRNSNPSAQVSFFSATSSVVGLAAARTMKARMAGVVSEASAVGSTWETYYAKANRETRKLLQSSNSSTIS